MINNEGNHAPNNNGNPLMTLRPGSDVCKPAIMVIYGFTKHQLAHYRAKNWLEGVHYKKNPANTIVYNVEQIGRWMGGEI